MSTIKECISCKYGCTPDFYKQSCEDHNKWEPKANPDPEKLYTAADLEQARAYERGRFCQEIWYILSSNQYRYRIDEAERDSLLYHLQTLGPVGKLGFVLVEEERERILAECLKKIDAEKHTHITLTSEEKNQNIGMNSAIEAVQAVIKGTAAKKAIDAIRSLGPIGETREETEARVRRETVEAVKNRGKLHISPNGITATVILTTDINAIAEGK